MGTATGNVINTLRVSKKGGDYFGPCEVCKRPMTEVSIAQQRREYKRADGTLYTSPIGGGVYGHAACVQSYGPFVS